MTTRWLRWLIVPVLVVPLGWLLFTGLGRDPREIASPLVGRPLPALSGTTLTGEQLSTADLGGGPLIVNVWASWCSPCAQEHPVLVDAAARSAVRMVGIVYQDTTDAARSFLIRYGDGGYPNLLDPDGRLALQLGVTGPPETFFVDAAGIVRAHHVGPVTPELMASELDTLGVATP